MALDTNVKSFKYSKANKILCVALCIVTFLGSMTLGASAVLVNVYNEHYFDNGISENYMDSYLFQNRFISDINVAVNDVCADAYAAQIEKDLEAKKDEIVEQAYKEYMRVKPFIRQNFDENYDEDGDAETTSYYGDDYTDNQSIVVKEYDDYCCIFDVNNIEVYNRVSSHADSERDYIGYLYDSFVKNETNRYDENSYNYNDINDYANSLIIFVSYGDDYYTNGDESQQLPSIEYAKSRSIYLVYQGGKLESRGLPDKVIDAFKNEVINKSEISKKATVAVSFLNFPTTAKSVADFSYWNDYYVSIAKFNAFARAMGNSVGIMIAAVILLVISFISGFVYFGISGKDSAEDKARLIFIDKLPIGLHFLLIFGIGFCAVYLWFTAVEWLATEFSIVFIISLAVGLVLLQCLLLEWCSSFTRLKNSEKGMKEHFIAIKLGRLIKKGFNTVKENLSYKPGAMQKNAIILTCLYFLCNLFALAVIIILLATFEFPWFFFGAFLLLADIAVNAVIIVKVISYIRNLDEIITAFSNKEELIISTGTLPKSLATLAVSMKYTNEELQAAVQKAIKDERLRSELITNVSHDLKTPLTSIITYVDLLSKCNIDDENAKSYIKVLDDKGARLKRLIEDLIEASKVTSGNVSVNITSINLAELCLQSTVDVQSDFEKADLQLIVKNTDTPLIVNADGVKTFRVIENLLSNARKYSAASSRVYVEVYDTPDFGVLEIKNISAQPLDISADELTERFVRGDKSRNQEGNGLGLSIAKELCRLQNGNLELIIDGDLFKARVKLPKADS